MVVLRKRGCTSHCGSKQTGWRGSLTAALALLYSYTARWEEKGRYKIATPRKDRKGEEFKATRGKRKGHANHVLREEPGRYVGGAGRAVEKESMDCLSLQAQLPLLLVMFAASRRSGQSPGCQVGREKESMDRSSFACWRARKAPGAKLDVLGPTDFCLARLRD